MLPNAEIDPLAAGAPESAPAHEATPPHTSYKDRLNRWAIARVENSQAHTIVARFRSHSDAEGHLKFLRHQFPEDHFIIVFEKQVA
ncbi:MAG: hypothetical protein NW220_00425 [Leptolyngbyaceae cyanobacterium bins.349]|nr:hypothetical protein [Leptolyngbyaceae cyanobacterium bins.349]